MSETFNVITHGVPALYYLYWAFYDILYEQYNCPSEALDPDELAILHFLASFVAVLTFGVSTLYHLAGRSPQMLKWDMTGISCMLAMCILLPVHTGFSCFPAVRALYEALFLVTVVFTTLIVHCDIPDELHVPIYTSVVGLTVIPLFHWMYISGEDEVRMFFPRLLWVYGSWAICLLIFLTKWPRRCNHELWHVLREK